MKSFIWITHEFEGFHNYPYAPDEVAYLKDTHRHLFKLKVWIEVFHEEREIEFHMFKKFIKKCFKITDFNHKSCERISHDLYKIISVEYPNREIKIEVSEDGECGSFITYYNLQGII